MFGVTGFFDELHFKKSVVEKANTANTEWLYLIREDFYSTQYVIIRAKLDDKNVISIKKINRDTGDIFTYKE